MGSISNRISNCCRQFDSLDNNELDFKGATIKDLPTLIAEGLLEKYVIREIGNFGERPTKDEVRIHITKIFEEYAKSC